ncbi:hypothetical protein [Proteiniborus sp.]|uniref:hypothetical protein n=1 Tax=Proteiniborus sp. TaxID=2079015 RepID=UPI003316F41F
MSFKVGSNQFKLIFSIDSWLVTWYINNYLKNENKESKVVDTIRDMCYHKKVVTKRQKKQNKKINKKVLTKKFKNVNIVKLALEADGKVNNDGPLDTKK